MLSRGARHDGEQGEHQERDRRHHEIDELARRLEACVVHLEADDAQDEDDEGSHGEAA